MEPVTQEKKDNTHLLGDRRPFPNVPYKDTGGPGKQTIIDTLVGKYGIICGPSSNNGRYYPQTRMLHESSGRSTQ